MQMAVNMVVLTPTMLLEVVLFSTPRDDPVDARHQGCREFL